MTTFLLSPADAGGRRALLLLRPEATFSLARRLREEGAPLGEVFAFVSGLYFRGKLVYANRFSRPGSLPLVITTNRGLIPAHQTITVDDLRGSGTTRISARDAGFRGQVAYDAARLPAGRIVLLGSIATSKYVQVLVDVLGDRLMYPEVFEGMGDMSRGSLLLRHAAEGRELAYRRVSSLLVGTRRWGT